jgi:hypothetical protein
MLYEATGDLQTTKVAIKDRSKINLASFFQKGTQKSVLNVPQFSNRTRLKKTRKQFGEGTNVFLNNQD